MGNAKYKQSHKEQGLCVHCPRPALPNRVTCLVCNDKDRKRQKMLFDNNPLKKIEANRKQKVLYVNSNRCISCGAPLGEQDEGCSHCVNCRLHKSIPKLPGCPPVTGKLFENYYEKITSQS